MAIQIPRETELAILAERKATGLSYPALAAKYGTSRQTVGKLIRQGMPKAKSSKPEVPRPPLASIKNWKDVTFRRCLPRWCTGMVGEIEVHTRCHVTTEPCRDCELFRWKRLHE